MTEAILTLRNPSGLHARPAALFVKAAARFGADINVTNLSRDEAKSASAKSMLGVLTLGVSQGHQIRLSADGEDADQALRTLSELVASGLGEPLAETSS